MTDASSSSGLQHWVLDSFKLVADTHRQVQGIQDKARQAVKARYKSPEDLTAFIENKGTPVYVLQGLKGLLAQCAFKLMGFDAGFVAPPNPNEPLTWHAQIRYGLLGVLLIGLYDRHPGCVFDHGVFVMPRAVFTVGYLAHQLHHWFACQAGLPGYDSASQREFRTFMVTHKGVVGAEAASMTEAQIMSLRHAIHREVEALQFIKSVTEEIFRPDRQARQITDGGIAHA